MKNKKAWIRIVEALVGILLIIGFLMLILNNPGTQKKELSSQIYLSENAILGEVQSNQTYRDYILTIDNSIELDDFTPNLKEHLNKRIPTYLDCTAKICDFDFDPVCDMNLEEKDIYVSSVMIAANLDEYDPKLIKLFCWTL